MSGYLGLFLGAFLAATLVPFSSEVGLAGMAMSSEWNLLWLWAAASIGNILGAVVNWMLGRYCLHWQGRRWFPVSAIQLEKASTRFQAYGNWSLLLSWVPIIGDPITFASGLLRTPFFIFLALVTVAKAGRYGLVMAAVSGVV